MTGKVVSIVNRKGGVGKTTLTVALADVIVGNTFKNMAPSVAKTMKLVAVDLDPQGSLTSALLNLPDANSREVALEKLSLDGRTAHAEILRRVSGAKLPMSQLLHHGVGLTDAQYALVANDSGAWESERNLLRSGQEELAIGAGIELLRELAAQNVIVLVDCPPGQTLFAEAAIRASDLILCPVTPDWYAFWGLEEFERFLGRALVDAKTPAFWVLNRMTTRASMTQRDVTERLDKRDADGSPHGSRRVTLLRDSGSADSGALVVVGAHAKLAARVAGSGHPTRPFRLRNAYEIRMGKDPLTELKALADAVMKALR
jgi:cellulose biosynthesis protein BcsQ